jgi:hypothetical protein
VVAVLLAVGFYILDLVIHTVDAQSTRVQANKYTVAWLC